MITKQINFFAKLRNLNKLNTEQANEMSMSHDCLTPQDEQLGSLMIKWLILFILKLMKSLLKNTDLICRKPLIISPLDPRAEQEIVEIAKEDVSLEDYLTMIGEFAKISTGVPVNSVFDMGSGGGMTSLKGIYKKAP